jgi:hypothetical protein
MTKDCTLTEKQIEFVDRLLKKALAPIIEAPVPKHIVDLIYGSRKARKKDGQDAKSSVRENPKTTKGNSRPAS